MDERFRVAELVQDPDFFRYTRGRFVRNEASEMARRSIRFNVDELARVAASVVGSTACVISKSTQTRCTTTRWTMGHRLSRSFLTPILVVLGSQSPARSPQWNSYVDSRTPPGKESVDWKF